MRSNTTRNIAIIAVVIALALGVGTGCLLTYRARLAAIADNNPGNQPPTTNPPGNAPGTGTDPGTTPIQPGTGSTKPPTSGTIGNNSGTPASGTWIDVDVTKQRVYIMNGSTVEREMVASTGMAGYETPLGTFKIQNRGEWFFSNKYQEGAKWWVSFRDWGVYLFHSVPMDKDKNVLQDEADRLGQPASHGCVRLTVENAKWIYDNIKEGTKVIIHE